MHPSVNRLIDVTSSPVAAQRWAFGGVTPSEGRLRRRQRWHSGSVGIWNISKIHQYRTSRRHLLDWNPVGWRPDQSLSPVYMQINMCQHSLLIIKYLLKHRGRQFGLASITGPSPARPSTAPRCLGPHRFIIILFLLKPRLEKSSLSEPRSR